MEKRIGDIRGEARVGVWYGIGVWYGVLGFKGVGESSPVNCSPVLFGVGLAILYSSSLCTVTNSCVTPGTPCAAVAPAPVSCSPVLSRLLSLPPCVGMTAHYKHPLWE